MDEQDRFIRTTVRMTFYDHRLLRAVCAITGETMSEFITRAAREELEKRKDDVNRLLLSARRDRKQADLENSDDGTAKLKSLE